MQARGLSHPLVSVLLFAFLPQIESFSNTASLLQRLGASSSLRSQRGFGPTMASPDRGGPTVTCEWLKENLNSVKVLDASWYLPTMERSPGVKFEAVAEFEKQRIPGAAFFDIDKICDLSSPHPHMMPTADFFAECVSKLGVTRDSHVVVYDGKGLFSAPRAWTMFQAFGHDKVHILDGGFPAWLAAGFEVDTAPKSAEASQKTAEYGKATGPAGILSMAQVEANIASRQFQLVDARPLPRFMGEAPEPRPIESGHIEGSYCVPFLDVITADGKMKERKDIEEALKKAKVDVSQPLAVTCGSGVSACIVRAALFQVGLIDVPLYDGAYTEWKVSGLPT
jgi:thiosulfate/3-mercaptopyruvate sulfurtransferase